MNEVAQRAVACKGWRWLPGMRTSTGVRVLRIEQDGYTIGWQEKAGHIWTVGPEHVPDLADPATIGCMLELVRTTYGDPALFVRLSDTTRASDGARAWEVLGCFDPAKSLDGRRGSFRAWGYASEAEALVAALEAAP